MIQASQPNYYELLGADPSDQLDAIEEQFRQLAYDAERSGDHSRIPKIVEAFKVLRDPAARSDYDRSLQSSTTETPAVSVSQLLDESQLNDPQETASQESQTESGSDAEAPTGEVEFCANAAARRRRELLAKFYKKRRDSARAPGLAIGGLEEKVDYSYETLEFHLWYMLEKTWLFREESGMLSITYHGVEQHEQNQLDGLI